MNKQIKKLWRYITRSWEDEPGYRHPRQEFLPPIINDLLGFIFIVAIVVNILLYLYKKYCL